MSKQEEMKTEKLAHELYIEKVNRLTYRIWWNRKHVDTIRGFRDKVLRRAWSIVINHFVNQESVHKLYLEVFRERCKHDISYRWQLLEVLDKLGYEGTAKLLMKGNDNGT